MEYACNFIKKETVFIKKETGTACSFIKKEPLARVFSCEFCEISKNSLFYRTPLVAASGINKEFKRSQETSFYVTKTIHFFTSPTKLDFICIVLV